MLAPDTLQGRARAWAGLMAGLSVVLVGLLCLFILPSLHSGPRDLHVGVVAPSGQEERLADALAAEAPGAYTLVPYGSVDTLDAAIEDRSVVGGLDLTGPGVTVHVASAGSTAVSGHLSASGAALAAGLGTSVAVRDVVPLPDADPTGVGVGGLAFPLVFGGIVPAVAFRSFLQGRRGWVLAGLLGFAAVGGLVVASVLTVVFGSVDGGALLPVAASVALGIAALALPLAGLQECLGGKGFTAAAMLMMFVGNPFAGIATGAQWLPAGVAAVGQLLPPGAAGTLVRAAAYFGGAGGLGAGLLLGGWALAGLALWFLAPVLGRRSEQARRNAEQDLTAPPDAVLIAQA